MLPAVTRVLRFNAATLLSLLTVGDHSYTIEGEGYPDGARIVSIRDRGDGDIDVTIESSEWGAATGFVEPRIVDHEVTNAPEKEEPEEELTPSEQGKAVEPGSTVTPVNVRVVPNEPDPEKFNELANPDAPNNQAGQVKKAEPGVPGSAGSTGPKVDPDNPPGGHKGHTSVEVDPERATAPGGPQVTPADQHGATSTPTSTSTPRTGVDKAATDKPADKK